MSPLPSRSRRVLHLSVRTLTRASTRLWMVSFRLQDPYQASSMRPCKMKMMTIYKFSKISRGPVTPTRSRKRVQSRKAITVLGNTARETRSRYSSNCSRRLPMRQFKRLAMACMQTSTWLRKPFWVKMMKSSTRSWFVSKFSSHMLILKAKSVPSKNMQLLRWWEITRMLYSWIVSNKKKQSSLMTKSKFATSSTLTIAKMVICSHSLATTVRDKKCEDLKSHKARD